jgi:co-chaperonin GroES (HSP10)
VIITPLAHRIVVQPDKAPAQRDSPIIAPDQWSVRVNPDDPYTETLTIKRDLAANSGTVIAVGDGPLKATRLRHAVIRRCVGLLDGIEAQAGHGCAAFGQLREDIMRYACEDADADHHVRVGDRVLFAAEAGHAIVLNERTDETVLILAEDDVLAVVSAAEKETHGRH